MTARDYLQIILRSWRITAAAALAGLLVAGVAVLVTPSKYSSTVTFYISTQTTNNTSTDAYQGSLLSQERVKSYTQLLSSYRLASEITSDLHLSADPTDIADEVSASVSPETVLLTAEVTDRDPQRAQAIAGSMGRAFPGLVATLERPAQSTAPPSVTAQVVQGPLLSDGPVSPRSSIYLLVGFAAGLLVGIGIAVLRRTLDRRVRSVEQLAVAFPEPLLGTLVRDRELEQAPLFLRARPQAMISENLRTVRTNFEMFNFDRRANCFVVTSAVEDEGKSTVLCNLALAEADAGRRVLVIEGDLRKPQASHYLRVSRDVGLTHVLAGKSSLIGAAQQGPADRLSVLAAGPLPPNPYEMLQSQQMTEVLETARAHYDIVLIDAPPLLPVADGLELARHADGVLFVVRAKLAAATVIARAHDLLAAAGVTHVAAVLNSVSHTDDEAYGYYTSGGYRAQRSTGTEPSTEPRNETALSSGRHGQSPTPTSAVSTGRTRVATTERPSPQSRTNTEHAPADLDAPTLVNGTELR